jgi:hypothetical protein
MKKLFFVLAMSSLAVVVADAAEQDTVNRCAAIISQFQQMPEKAIPRDVLRRAKGLAIMSVVKAGFIFSAKGGQGVVIARTRRGWSGPSFIATGGGGWGLQAGAQVTDFVIPRRKCDDRRGCQRCGRAGGPHRGRRGHANSGRLHLQQEQRPLCWRVIGRRSDWNAKAIQFQLLRRTC